MNLIFERLEIPTTAESVVLSTDYFSLAGRAVMVYIRIKRTVCQDYLLQNFVWTGAQSLKVPKCEILMSWILIIFFIMKSL
jgi:hypothetical protein